MQEWNTNSHSAVRATKFVACMSEGGGQFRVLEVLQERFRDVPLPRARDRSQECSERKGVAAQSLEVPGEGGTGR